MRTFIGGLIIMDSSTYFPRPGPNRWQWRDRPAVTALRDTGDKLDLGALYAKGYTLVYFFPKADTPGCTAEGCSLRDAYQDSLRQRHHRDRRQRGRRARAEGFKEKYHFRFTLLATTTARSQGVRRPVHEGPGWSLRVTAVFSDQQEPDRGGAT